MTNWKYRIELKDIVKDYDNDQRKIPGIAEKVAQRIQESDAFKHIASLENIADQFEICGESETEFDAILDELYDIADQEKIWIAYQF